MTERVLLGDAAGLLVAHDVPGVQAWTANLGVAIGAVAAAPDGDRIYVGVSDGTIAGSEVRVLDRDGGELSAYSFYDSFGAQFGFRWMAVSPDGAVLYALQYQTVFAVQAADGTLLWSVTPGGSGWAHLSPDGARLYVTGGGSVDDVTVYDTADGSSLGVAGDAEFPAGQVATSPDGTILYALAKRASTTLLFKSFTAATAVQRWRHDLPVNNSANQPTGMFANAAGAYAVQGGSGTDTVVHRTAAGALGWSLNVNNHTAATLALSLDRSRLYLGTSTGAASQIIDLGAGTVAGTLPYTGVTAMAVTVANRPPLAPTGLSPSGITIDRTTDRRFRWTPSDPDEGDSQSQFRLRIFAVGTATPVVDVTVETPSAFYDLPGGTLAVGSYEWDAQTWDAAGEPGTVSAREPFTASTPPAGATITAPTAGQTIGTETFLVVHSAAEQDAVERRRVADVGGVADPTTVYWSELQNSAASRERLVAFPTNNRVEHVQVRVQRSGLWSEWASVDVTVSYTPPAVPTVTVDDTSLDGAIRVQASHPTPGVGVPPVTHMDVWRRRRRFRADGTFRDFDPAEGGETGWQLREGTGLAPSALFEDFSPGSGEVYAYRVHVQGDNGTSSWSVWTADPPEPVDPSDPTVDGALTTEAGDVLTTEAGDVLILEGA